MSFYKALITKGKDIKWLSKQLGVSTQAVYGWKLKRSKPTPANLKKMSKLLGIDLDSLFKEFYS